MKNLQRLSPAWWLAAIVIAVAMVSHALGQPHDVTLIVALVSVCLLALDWLITPRK